MNLFTSNKKNKQKEYKIQWQCLLKAEVADVRKCFANIYLLYMQAPIVIHKSYNLNKAWNPTSPGITKN